MEDLLEYEFAQTDQKNITLIYSDRKINDSFLRNFCDECEKKYSKKLEHLYEIDLTDQDQLTGEALNIIGNCSSFPRLSSINIKGTKIGAKSILASVESIVKSDSIGSRRPLIEFSEKYEEAISEVNIKVDQSTKRLIDQAQKNMKLDEKYFINAPFYIRYEAGYPKECKGMKWVQIVT